LKSLRVTHQPIEPAAGDGAARRARLAVAALALVLLVVPLAVSVPLTDPDEGLHAAIAQEMVLRGDYVTPTFLGAPFLDKPILFFWTEALALRALGPVERAIRLPPLLFGLAGMLSVALLARRLFGEPAALASGICYASMLLPLGVSEVAVHDIGLVPFMCVAMWCVLRAADSPRARLWGLPLGVCLGCAILTKGLVGVVFVALFAICVAAARRDAARRMLAALIVGGTVAVVLALPWYVAMERAHAGYLYYYFVERHVRGYLTATQRHAGRAWWYYLPILVGGTLPWTGYLAAALRHRPSGAARATATVLWLWLAIDFVFLSVGESKLVTYVLPLFPGLAILVGEYVARNWSLRPARAFSVARTICATVLALLPLLAAIVVRAKFGESSPTTWTAAAIAIPLLSFAGWRAARARTLGGYLAGAATGAALSITVSIVFVGPPAARWMTAKDLAAALNAAGRLPPRVLVVDERLGSVVFYLSPALRAEASADRILTASKSETIERLNIETDDTIVAVRGDEVAKFEQLLDAPVPADAQAGTFTLYRVGRLRAAARQR
jgi:4-amino-4-deoxy-L-arabinose transferase-like glycosyltransferase